MYCLEWWLYEIAGLLSGIISEVELGAQSIIYELAAIAYVVIPLHYFFSCSWGFSLPLNNFALFTLLEAYTPQTPKSIHWLWFYPQ